MSLTLTQARERLVKRARLQASYVPDKFAKQDVYSVAPSAPAGTSQVTLAIGAHTSEGLRSSAYDKRTGEWKARVWGGRKTDFEAPNVRVPKLYDHHLDKEGKPMGRRKQESNFFITINTNRRTFGATDMEACAAAVRLCFGPQVYEQLRFGPRDASYEPDRQWPQAVVEHVRVTGGVERGPQTGSLHAHVHCRIVHWTQLQIDVRRLQYFFKEAYNARAEAKIPPKALPSVQVKLMQQSDWNAIIAEYLAKSVAQAA